MPFIGDFAGMFLSFWLIFYIKNTNLIAQNKVWVMIGEMTVNVMIDVVV